MIGFLLLVATAAVLCVVIMIRRQRKQREIVLFTVLVLLGIADWISIFLDHKFKPTKVIAHLMDWVGL